MLISDILRDVLSDTSDCCFLCFNTISEIEVASNIEDEVFLGIEIETTEVLYEMIYTVLGEKVLDSISPHNMICQKCTGTVINCYKFIQKCRQNIEQLHCTVDSLQKCAQYISTGNNRYKSLFVALDTSNCNVDMYYDERQNINNQTLLRKRFQRLYEDSQQCSTDIEAESNYSPNNKNGAEKSRTEKSQLAAAAATMSASSSIDCNTSNCNVDMYYDERQNINNQTLLRKRFQRLYKDSQQCSTDIEAESNYSPNNKNGAEKSQHAAAAATMSASSSIDCNTSNCNVDMYYDERQNINNQTLLRKRFQRLYEDSQQCSTDIEAESNYSPNNKNGAEKSGTEKSSILLSIELLADIVYDKDDLKKKRRNLKCKTCLKLYATPAKIRQHYLRAHAPKDFKCSQCQRSYGSSVILKQHIKDSHSTAVCSQCGKTYPNIYSLKRHEERHIGARLVCQKCGKVYKGKRTFDNHIEQKLCERMRKSNAEATFSCDYCGKKYAQKAALSVHIRLEHENGKALVCNWCGKKYGCMSRLQDHILKHTKQKNFECDLCGGRFVTKTSLLYHTRTHTGEKPYKCEICEKSFLSASRRSEHVKRHHNQFTEECDICSGTFKAKGSLARHRKQHFDARSKLYCDPSD